MIDLKDEVLLRAEWYTEAREQTLATLPAFLQKLSELPHTYGSICMAITAAGVGAMCAVNNSPNGGITGAQAGYIFWELRKAWLYEDGPAKLISYKELLYPQYRDEFDRVVASDTAAWLRAEAKKLLKESSEYAHGSVLAHWRKMAEGWLPFGYRKEPGKGGDADA